VAQVYTRYNRHAMTKEATLQKPPTIRCYQTGSLKDEGDRWAIRWRIDVLDPLTGDAKRVRKWDVFSKKAFPTKRLAQRELDAIVSRANGKTLAVPPPGLQSVDVLLCDSCRERLVAALQAR
jgi:hypothetical protein